MSRLSSDDFFVVRASRLPLEHLYNLPENYSELAKYLKEWASDPLIEEAIYIASPSFLKRLQSWNGKADNIKGEKIVTSLLKYFIRMSSRSTPFGLFSGVALGSFTNLNKLVINQPKSDKRKSQLDFSVLKNLEERLFCNMENESIRCIVNPTIHRIQNFIHYIEPYTVDEIKHYKLSHVEEDSYINYVLKICQTEQKFNLDWLIEDFYKSFSASIAIEYQDAAEYIHSLVNEKIILPEFTLGVTDYSSIKELISLLLYTGHELESRTLTEAIIGLEKIDLAENSNHVSNSNSIAYYEAISKLIGDLKGLDKKNYRFQVDILRSFSKCELSSSIANDVSSAISILSRSDSSKESIFADFIEKFNERFDGQMVPLLRVVNDEVGIIPISDRYYSSDLLSDLGIQSKKIKNIQYKEADSLTDKMICEEYFKSRNGGGHTIKLSSEDLEDKIKNASDNSTPSFPESIASLISVYKDEDEKPIIHFKGCFGPSAANLLGRFCHLDEVLANKVRKHLEREERSSPEGAIFAEVLHLPSGRAGNVVRRPLLRNYEIVLTARSSLPDEQQIKLSDLWVYIERGTIKLWSSRLNRQVIPRLSSAHSYNLSNFGLYKFLCSLQSQNSQVPNFSLPKVFDQAPTTPRIMLDNIVLHEKAWRVKRTLLAGLWLDGVWNSSIWSELLAIYGIERYVSFADSDNVLTIDLYNPAMVDILLNETKGYDVVVLKECLNLKYKSAIQDNEGKNYSNELVIPFFYDIPKNGSQIISKPRLSSENELTRSFSPGSQWMSFKIYGAVSLTEVFLIDHLRPLITDFSNTYNKFFFIRYKDPDWHLRLRFMGVPQKLYSELLPAINKLVESWLKEGLIHRFEMTTYDREIERYGGSRGIALAEELFFHESHMVLELLAMLQNFDASYRWRSAIMAADTLLNAFGYELANKFEIVDNLRSAFGAEFNDSKLLRKRFGKKFKEIEHTIKKDLSSSILRALGSEVCVRSDTTVSPEQLELRKCIYVYGESVKNQVVKGYLNIDKENKLSVSKHELVGSFLHMLFNRIFKANSREHEFVLYDFLRRHYQSRMRSESV